MNNPPDISQDPKEYEAGAVALVFMHLAAEKRLIYRILIFTGFFVMGLFWLILLAWYDYPIFH